MLLAEGLAARTWGNVSCRSGNNSMFITPSGLAYEKMLPEDIVETDMHSGKWKGNHKPSSEWAVHAAAYEAFPDAGFVIHTHQTYASAIGLTGLESLNITPDESCLLGGVAQSEYGLPGTKRLAKNVFLAFKSAAHCVLMPQHGAVIVGKDRKDAFQRAKLLEDICRRSCKSQNEIIYGANESLAKRLTASVNKEYEHAAYTTAMPVLACAEKGLKIYAQLDDMAQIFSRKIAVTKPDEHSVMNALKSNEFVLVTGVGGICRASTEDDCIAMCRLAEKACICRLHTKALGIESRISGFNIWIMRRNYLKNYSKKIGG